MEHEDIDTVQHRLVRWRGIGDWSATIWVSCYTQPTAEGIRLAKWTEVQQSVLERSSAIVYKHGAGFASLTDRYPRETSRPSDLQVGGVGRLIADKFVETFRDSRESQLESREQVLRRREADLKECQRELEAEAERQKEMELAIAFAAKRQEAVLEAAAAALAPEGREAEHVASSVAGEGGSTPAGAEEAEEASPLEAEGAHANGTERLQELVELAEKRVEAAAHPEHDGMCKHEDQAESTRIPVKEMGD